MFHIDSRIFPLVKRAGSQYQWNSQSKSTYRKPIDPSSELAMLLVVEVRYSIVFETIMECWKLLFRSDFDSNRITLIARPRLWSFRGEVEGSTQTESKIRDTVRASTCGSKERRRRGRNGVSGFDLVSLICFGGVDAARGMEGDIIGAIEQRQYGLEID